MLLYLSLVKRPYLRPPEPLQVLTAVASINKLFNIFITTKNQRLAVSARQYQSLTPAFPAILINKPPLTSNQKFPRHAIQRN
jgi:hypothetical protein